jgi:hypothetical protein
MSQSTTITCDRCGAPVTPWSFHSGDSVEYQPAGGLLGTMDWVRAKRSFDLCTHCAAKFLEWMGR